MAFESRNPRIDWVGEWTGRCRALGAVQITETIQITGADGEFISFQTSYQIPGGTLTTDSRLRFPSHERVQELISRSGLVVRDVFGGWSAGSFEPERSREMIFIAEKAK